MAIFLNLRFHYRAHDGMKRTIKYCTALSKRHYTHLIIIIIYECIYIIMWHLRNISLCISDHNMILYNELFVVIFFLVLEKIIYKTLLHSYSIMRSIINIFVMIIRLASEFISVINIWKHISFEITNLKTIYTFYNNNIIHRSDIILL